MGELIVREEGFRMGILDKVPIPEEGECFLLYQTGRQEKGSIVINRGVKYSATNVRHGHYDKKVIFTLKPQNIVLNEKIVMEDREFCFEVVVKISYVLQDVEKFFFEEQVTENKLCCDIKENVKKFDGGYGIRQRFEVQRELEYAIEKALSQYKSLRITVQQIEVNLDSEAEKMWNSNRDKTVKIHQFNNEMDEKISQKEQEKRILKTEYELRNEKIKGLAQMMGNFGSLGPIVDEYMQGKMDGKELYDYIWKGKNNDLSMLSNAVSNDLLTQTEVMDKVSKILDDGVFLAEKKRVALPEQGETVEQNAEEEAKKEMPEIEPSDGDYI